VDPEALYRVATLDYLAQGNDDMVAFQKGTDVVSPQEKKNDVRFLIRAYFESQMKNGVTIDPQIEGRIIVK
jgi:2',3'-cyclic-nucleotide 2'-phosphodiesterase (5'-nucleotidase family)